MRGPWRPHFRTNGGDARVNFDDKKKQVAPRNELSGYGHGEGAESRPFNKRPAHTVLSNVPVFSVERRPVGVGNIKRNL